MAGSSSNRTTAAIAFVIAVVALVSYLAGQGSQRRRAFIVDSTRTSYESISAVGQLTNESMMAWVDQRLQRHAEVLKTQGQGQQFDFKAIEDYLFRPFSKLNNELDQKSTENAIHSTQLSTDLTFNKAILYNLPDTTDEWLSAISPDLDWRSNAAFPMKVGYPEIKDVPKCEQWIDDVLSQRTDMQKADPVEPQTLPDSVCEFFRKSQATKVCRPAGSRSWIFHALGYTDMDMVRGFMNRFRSHISQFNTNGMVYFTFMEMLINRRPTHWDFPERTWIVDATVTAAKSFKQIYGVWPLVVVNTEREKLVMEREGIPVFLDSTLIWRGAQVAGYRWLSRTTIVKYIYAYLILEAGYTAVFFDSDSFWARKLILPQNGVQTYDFIINEEGFTRVSEGKYWRGDPMPEPKAHGYRPLHQSHGGMGGLRQTTCNGFSDTVLYNSGIWVAYPTEWSMRFLSAFIDNQLVTWSFWWEQNLFQHLLPIYAAWGLRLGVFGNGVSPHAEPQYRTKEDCNAYTRYMTAWVHTKSGAASWKICGQPGIYSWKAPKDFVDAKSANITMSIIADSQR